VPCATAAAASRERGCWWQRWRDECQGREQSGCESQGIVSKQITAEELFVIADKSSGAVEEPFSWHGVWKQNLYHVLQGAAL